MSLLANPSHLEAVDPVVLGKVLLSSDLVLLYVLHWTNVGSSHVSCNEAK